MVKICFRLFTSLDVKLNRFGITSNSLIYVMIRMTLHERQDIPHNTHCFSQHQLGIRVLVIPIVKEVKQIFLEFKSPLDLAKYFNTL